MIGSSFFIFGLCVGSFINCLVYRLHLRDTRGVLIGRSFCPRCKHQLAWYDNIPLLSFILLKARCRYCQKKISIHYPLVELGTGVLTLLVLFHLRGVLSGHLAGVLFYLLITYALIAIFVSDMLYFTVPDEVVWSAIGISFLRILVTGHWSLVIPGLLSGLFFLALVLATKGRGMGLGDVKLAGLMGLVLGYPKIIIALYLAFLTGAVVGVILILLRKKHFGEHIPFGPFLCTATIISLFWGEIIWKQGLVLLLLRF